MVESTEPSNTVKWSSNVYERIDGHLIVVLCNNDAIGAITLPTIQEAEEWQKIIQEMNKNPNLT